MLHNPCHIEISRICTQILTVCPQPPLLHVNESLILDERNMPSSSHWGPLGTEWLG